MVKHTMKDEGGRESGPGVRREGLVLILYHP